MGHLINPIAMRIGWFRNWTDSWFLELCYYPEFLHEVFKLRVYVKSFFILPALERMSMLFSHVELICQQKMLFLRLFVYSSYIVTKIADYPTRVQACVEGSIHLPERQQRWQPWRKRRGKRRVHLDQRSLLFFHFFSFFLSFYDLFLGRIKNAEAYRGEAGFNRIIAEREKNEGLRAAAAGLRGRHNRAKRDEILRSLLAEQGKSLANFLKSRNPNSLNSRWLKSRFKGLWLWARRSSVTASFKLAKQSRLKSPSDSIFSKARPRRFIKRVVGPELVRRLKKSLLFFLHFSLNFFDWSTLDENLEMLYVIFFEERRNSYLLGSFKVFLIYLLIFQLIRANPVNLGSVERGTFYSNILLYSMFLLHTDRFILTYLGKFFTIILANFFWQFKLKVEIFLLSNDTITGDFLASYISKKLARGFMVGGLMNPIIKELRLVGRLSRLFKSDEKPVMFVSPEGPRAVSKSGFSKEFIDEFFYLYKKLMLRFFSFNGTLINVYLLWFLAWFSKQGLLSRAAVVGLSKNFMVRRHLFLFFFNYEPRYTLNHLDFIFNNVFFLSTSGVTSSLLVFFLFDDLFSPFNLIFNGGFKFNIEAHSFIAANFFFNRLLRHSYVKRGLDWLLNFKKINKARIRSQKFFSEQGFLGFKIQLRGRFTRKQRSSSVTFKQGNVPLNTLSGIIDYGFATVPLHNSLASVKVWLFKNKNFSKWLLKGF